MPCVVYSGKGREDYHKDFPRTPDGTVSYYMLPPVRYPDGKRYISFKDKIVYHTKRDSRAQLFKASLA